MESTKRKMILVGAGFAGSTHWIPSVTKSSPFELVGVIDPDEGARKRALEAVPGIWTAAEIDVVPPMIDPQKVIVFVATPDHLPVILEFGDRGFDRFIVEKPLVSQYADVDVLIQETRSKRLKIYSIDHYYQKLLPLEFVLRGFEANDPRLRFLSVSGGHDSLEIPGVLGKIQGVTYTNIEAGDLGIPYLDAHPWVEHDPVTGGMLRDLGPHAFASLIRVGLTSDDAAILDVNLAKLNKERDSFEPVREKHDIEMWVRALIVSKGITANITFGKAPLPGKERSIAVFAEKGVYYGGLARGQSALLLTKDDRVTHIKLSKSENDFVLEEAAAFFSGKLPLDFDGNLCSSIGALRMNKRLREQYMATLL